MNQNSFGMTPRLHMGCGESLCSKLLLSVPRKALAERTGKVRSEVSMSKTVRGRARG